MGNSFFKASTNKKDLQQGGNSAYINKSGLFPVTILGAFVNKSPNGSQSVDFFVDYNGQKQVLYGNLKITNNNGEENKIGAKVFNQLMIIANVEEIEEPVDGMLPIGKSGKEVSVALLEEFSDVEVLMRIQLEYSEYQGDIKERKIIKAFFRANDNASAEEIVNSENIGEQIKKEEKYFDNITYKDNLTTESVAEWVAKGRPKNSLKTSSAVKAPSFGAGKTFGSK